MQQPPTAPARDKNKISALMLDVTSINCHVHLQMSVLSTFKSALFSQREQKKKKTGEEMKAIVLTR